MHLTMRSSPRFARADASTTSRDNGMWGAQYRQGFEHYVNDKKREWPSTGLHSVLCHFRQYFPHRKCFLFGPGLPTMSWTRPLEVFVDAVFALWLLDILCRPLPSDKKHINS